MIGAAALVAPPYLIICIAFPLIARALQSGLSLEPYATTARAEGLPAPAAVPAGLAFFEQLRTWMQAFPRPDRTAPTSSDLLRSACSTRPRPMQTARAAWPGQWRRARTQAALKEGGLAPVVNGWTLTFHMFDYNLDHPGPGSIDDPAWRIGDPG